MKEKWAIIRYNLAVSKGIITRRSIWLFDSKKYARSKSAEILPIKIYRHNSLIRRTLGNVNPKLQENKALNMFPDFGRTIPFGTGTSIMYNYLDYQFTNNTIETFQLLISVEEDYLCGELKATHSFSYVYHVIEKDMYFKKEEDGLYRHNKIYRRKNDKYTGDIMNNKLILENFSKVLYDESFVNKKLIK